MFSNEERHKSVFEKERRSGTHEFLKLSQRTKWIPFKKTLSQQCTPIQSFPFSNTTCPSMVNCFQFQEDRHATVPTKSSNVATGTVRSR